MKTKHLILPLAAATLLLLASCDKTGDTAAQRSETFDVHYGDSADNGFFSKLPSGGFLIDTAWDGDTTINF